MSEELGLTEKQHKQVYKLYLRQARKAQTAESSARGGAPDFGGAPPEGGMGMGRPEGGFGGGTGSGMRPGGMGGGMRPGGMGGGRPPGGRRPDDGEMGGQRPSGPPPAAMTGGFYEEPEKEIAKREKKMKKILSAEQFAQWRWMDGELRRDRLRRQFDRNMMPDRE